MLKKIWQSLTGKSDPGIQDSTIREIKKPQDLHQGDLIRLSDSFALPDKLRDQKFEIIKVMTSVLPNQYFNEFVLSGGDSEQWLLSFHSVSGQEVLAIKKRITREEVGNLFDLDQVADIFEFGPQEGVGYQLHQRAEAPGGVIPLEKTYVLNECAVRGCYYEKDYRPLQPPKSATLGKPFDYYYLESPNEKATFEFRVWQTGDTDAFIGLLASLDLITEMWPRT